MWILNFIPDFYTYLTMLGIVILLAAWGLGMIPFIKQYALPLNIIGTVLTVWGIWWLGGVRVENEWRARVKEVEAKLAIAEAKSQKVNTKIVTKIVTQTQSNHDKANERTRYINSESSKLDSNCEIPSEAIKALNSAVKNQEIKEEKK